jgi:hypothetical protein
MKEANSNMLLGFNIHPYFIQALNSPEEVKLISENLPDANDPRFKEFKGNFDFLDEVRGIDIDDFQTMVFADEESLRKFLRYSELIGYKYKVGRADKKLFKNQLDLSKAGQSLKEIIYEFITKHFNINDVLDKMNEGCQLTELDYKILKSN